ncbi:ATP-binding protein [Phytohabitans flavus]|uniref:histidine kinase n=1 Tax=Phytohabitans flavus TaxID=1076124 RepID=A0A6F8XLG6_9ACTN|nr:HAMP domain-containing sensor histidine kinase [Phytohabitans flavus]BCB74656.1 two-component sensor histidine kinase [Phytohabitans flavus]
MVRLTIRTRLTLWYSAVFAATGAVVLTLMYLLIHRELITASQTVVAELTAVDSAVTLPAGATVGTALPAQTSALEAATTDARVDALRTIIVETGAVFATLAVVSLVLCWLVAGRALRPLRQITSTAAVLSHEDMNARISLHGPHDEVRKLAETFNGMLDRLSHVFQAQRLFVANASHELRTPLTVIRTAAEMALSRPTRAELEYRRALDTVAAAATRSDEMLTSLLRLARTQVGMAVAPVDVAEVAAEAAAKWPVAGPPLRQSLAPARCVGDPIQLELLLRNLLDNARRYNVDGGEVWIATGHSDGAAWVRVENTGPTIDPEDIPGLRQPFQRGQGRGGGASGAGLGLAIVGAIVDAHDAAWTLTPRVGGGLSATVTLPSR